MIIVVILDQRKAVRHDRPIDPVLSTAWLNLGQISIRRSED
jgi:hypothetical protein